MERQERHTPGRLSWIESNASNFIHIEGADNGYQVATVNRGSRAERKANAARLVASWNVLLGIPAAALEKLASLPPKERFGALSDIAKLHEMKEE